MIPGGGYADWLSVNIGDFSGDLTDLGVNLQYQAFKNLGIGAGYQYFNIDVRADSSDWNGKVDYTYQGPSIFLTVNF